MEKRWIMLTDSYESPLEKNAINMIYAEVSAVLPYVLPMKLTSDITEEELAQSHVILIGRVGVGTLLERCEQQGVVQPPQSAEGYAIYAGSSIFGGNGQMIVIAGYDASGVLYGCMDFCNRYLGDVAYRNKYLWTDKTFDEPLGEPLNPWQSSSAPAIKRRAIWTWGHVIYDYRNFFQNMARLRLNEIVIWNDVAPLNAAEVVAYAHSLNIKVIWGFAWGWDTSCTDVLAQYGADLAGKIKEQVLATYEREYSKTQGDGIYFQTFTEHSQASAHGKSVAQIVTELVNDIAQSLFEKYPQLHIQFGLHATSVCDQLEYLKKVDKRIQIVWEDCGSFPYDYYAHQVENFDRTLAFTEATLKLRGEEEQWGAVLKGMLNLDWQNFEHFSAPYLLGERTNRYIQKRQGNKDRIWKLQQADWLKSAEYVRRIAAAVAQYGKENAVVQALVEDAMLENKIAFPVALYAEMLWAPNTDALEMIGQVSKFPCVTYSNI